MKYHFLLLVTTLFSLSFIRFVHPFISSTFSHKNITQIARLNLQTLLWQEEEWPNDFYETLIFADKVHADPQPYQKRNIAFNVLKQTAHAPTDFFTVIDQAGWEDLELLCGKKNQEIYLANVLDNTHTELGRVTFFSLLVQPTDDRSLITQRKAAVQELYKNQHLYQSLVVYFDALSRHENTLLSFWRPSDLFRTTSERFYFQHPWFIPLNKYPLALEARNRFLQCNRYASFSANCLAALILPLYGASKLIKASLPPFMHNLGEKLQHTNKGALTNLVENTLCNETFNNALLTVIGVYTAFSLRENYEWERDLMTLEQCMQKKLIHVALYLKTTLAIYKEIKHNTALIENIPSLQNLKTFFEEMQTADDELSDFFELIHAHTFKQAPSPFSRQGNIVRGYKLMHTIKNKLIPLFEALGHLDAFLSVATFVRNQNNNNAPCSFVEFCSSPTPYIYLEDFWHPILSGHKAVKNTITLGGTEHRQNIIVTGPNAGGKSTILKGIAINLILAQSFGITTARKAVITPFTKILTYLNIVDDIGSGSSLFKSEVLRAYDIISTVAKLENETNIEYPRFAFVIADELFNSTTPKEGEAGGYSIAHHLGSFNHCITAIATHFELLTHLEKNTDTFQNYRVIIQEHDNGTFNYLYKLEPGISNQHIAFKMLAAEGFAPHILTMANDILTRN